MATQVVELSGDEAALLRSLDRVIQKELEHERSLSRLADTGDATGLQLEDAMGRVQRANDSALKGMIAQLGQLGPAGRQAADALKTHLAESGKGGFPTFDSLLQKIESLDPTTAAVSERIKTELAAADRQDAFDKTLAGMKSLGGDSAKVAAEIEKHLKAAGNAPASFDKYLAQLIDLGGESAKVAGEIEKQLKTAAGSPASFDKYLAQLTGLGGESAKVAAEIEKQLKTAADTPASFDKYLAALDTLNPAAKEVAEKVLADLDAVDRKDRFNETLKSLRAVGPVGEAIAKQLSLQMQTAATEAAGGLDGIITKMKEFDPTIEAVAQKIKTELEAADRVTKFDESIAALKKINPEAAKAAQAIRDKMDKADSEVKFDNLINELKNIDPAAAKAAENLRSRMHESSESGKTYFKGFATSAIGEITSIAGAYVSIDRAIDLVVTANRKVLETNKQIFESLKETQDGDSRLLQIATSDEDFQALRGKADELAITQGIGRDEARNLIFSARSENFEDSIDSIAANAQVIEVASQAGVAGQIPALFKEEGLTGAQAIDATLAGAQQSRLTFEQIGGALPSASEGAALAGAKSDETIASLSVLASDFKSADTAADRIKAFGTAISLDRGDTDSGRESLAGLGLIEATKKLLQFPEDQQRKFLGNSAEVNIAFSAMAKNLEEIENRRQTIRAAIDTSGTNESVTGKARTIAQNDSLLSAQRRVVISENTLEISREDHRATGEGSRQAGTNEALNSAEIRGVAPLKIAVTELASEALAGLGMTELSRTIIPQFTGNELYNLQRDLSFATESGDESAAPALLATNKLFNARNVDLNATLSQDDVAEYLRGSTKAFVAPSDVSKEMQVALTNAIVEAASKSRGTFDAAFGASFSLPANQQLGLDGSAAADRIETVSELLTNSRRTADAIERQNELVAKQNEILAEGREYAPPSAPLSPDFNSIQAASLDQADSR